MKTKPFDLQAFKEGKRAETKSGIPVRYLGHLKGIYSIAVAMDNEEGEGETLMMYTVTGTEYTSRPSNMDIQMLVDTTPYWINVYRNKITGQVFPCHPTYASKEDAIANKYKEYDSMGDPAVLMETVEYLGTVLIHEQEV